MTQVEVELRESRRMWHFLATGEVGERYTDVAVNEAVDIRIIDGPASELIPPGRGRSLSRGMRP